MTMRVRVRERYWNGERPPWDTGWATELREAFGEENSIHELSAISVVEHIVKFGRAKITVDAEGIYTLEFHNDYD